MADCLLENIDIVLHLTISNGIIEKHKFTLEFNRRKLGTNWHWLQLLCLEEEILQRTQDGRDIETIVIPDTAWRRTYFWTPKLKVQYAISTKQLYIITNNISKRGHT